MASGCTQVRERLATLHGDRPACTSSAGSPAARHVAIHLPLQHRMNATALIAEDEPLLAQALQAELARAWPRAARLATAGDGASAVQQALALRPDVLFFDIRMPGLSGLEAAAQLADEWPDGDALPRAGVRHRVRPVRRAGLRGAGGRLRAQARAARAAGAHRGRLQELLARASRHARRHRTRGPSASCGTCCARRRPAAARRCG